METIYFILTYSTLVVGIILILTTVQKANKVSQEKLFDKMIDLIKAIKEIKLLCKYPFN